ncbi:MAG: transposase [Thermosynechococcaceae cyanobacterium]
MSSWLETCRKVYNYALRERKDWMASRKCSIDRCSLKLEYIMATDAPYPGYYQQQNALTAAKVELIHLKDVQSQVLQEPIRRIDGAFAAFRDRGFGFPRFKKFGQYRSFTFPQFKNNPIRGNQIKLPKLGEVTINLHRPIPDGFVIKQVRVIRKADIWYASVNIQSDVSVPDPMPYGHAVGVDIGLEKFLSTSDGQLVKPPKFFRVMQGKLKLLQRRLSRKQRRSKNYEKARLKVARMHHTIDNSRKNFHYQQAHRLCNGAAQIFMEDLDYRISAKGFLGKHMLDAGFGQFRSITQYVCWKRGKTFGVVDARYTSQECPECGVIKKKDLSERVHRCECGYTTDRDVAAAQVICTRGLRGMETACGSRSGGE